MRIYAIFACVGTEYETIAPIYMSLDLNKLQKKLKKVKKVRKDAYITYVELHDSEITDNIIEDDEISKDFLWKIYEGRISQYVFKNLETGEITEYEPDCDFDEVHRTRIYKEGKLVEEYIDDLI